MDSKINYRPMVAELSANMSEEILLLMEDHDIDLQGLSEKTGIKRDKLDKYLHSGQFENITIEVLCRILWALEEDPKDFLYYVSAVITKIRSRSGWSPFVTPDTDNPDMISNDPVVPDRT